MKTLNSMSPMQEYKLARAINRAISGHRITSYSTRDAKEIARLLAVLTWAPTATRSANPLQNGPFAGPVPQVSKICPN